MCLDNFLVVFGNSGCMALPPARVLRRIVRSRARKLFLLTGLTIFLVSWKTSRLDGLRAGDQRTQLSPRADKDVTDRIKSHIAEEEIQRILNEAATVREVLARRKLVAQMPIPRYNYRELVRSNCEKYDNSNLHKVHDPLLRLSRRRRKLLFEHLIYDDDMKVIYCAVPKIATHNWRRVMRSIAGKLEHPPEFYEHVYTDMTVYKQMSKLSMKEAKKRITGYFKFMTVRNPDQRVVSLYFDKFSPLARKSEFVDLFGKRVRQKGKVWNKSLRKSGLSIPDEVGLNKSDTFYSYADIARFIATQKVDINEHWSPMTELCQPCAVQYDFIGRLEDEPGSSQAILKAIGLPDSVSLPGRDTVHYFHRKVDNDRVQRMNSQLHGNEYAAIKNHYVADFVLFNYTSYV